MRTRRAVFSTLCLATVSLTALPLSVQAADDPVAPIAAIYKRASAGKGDSGGQFVWVKRKDRARWFSREMIRLWDAAEAKTAKGDMGPPGADPVSASQDPMVRDPKVTLERRDGDRATVIATFAAWQPEPRATVRYDMRRENGRWMIDDIWNVADGKSWSLKQLLAGWKG